MLGSDFAIEVTKTRAVPHASDPAITFPDVLTKTQGTKLIETCVLYIDIRRSTELNFSHQPKTVAKLYTVFVRAMTRVARHYGGHIRGIIGDRVMVIFDSSNCFTNAVNCAVAMNTVSQHIINKAFKAGEVSCGIGIDAGNMLATKTGVRRHGFEQGNYRNLVWLGRPANIASKLTDLANKSAETVQETVVDVAYDATTLNQLGGLLSPSTQPANSLGALFTGTSPSPPSNLYSALVQGLGTPFLSGSPRPERRWKEETLREFLSNVKVEYASYRLVHSDPNFRSFYFTERTREVRAPTPPILLTARVWKGFRSEKPDDPIIKGGWFKRVRVKTPGLTEAVMGGDVIFPILKD